MADTVTRPAPPRAQADVGARPGQPLHLRNAVKLGAIGGVVAVILSAGGMVEALAGREVVAPVTLGYIILALVPFVFAYSAAKPPPALEGFEPPRPGPRNVATGAIAGLLTGLVLAAFVVLVSAVNVRQVLANVSPRLVDELLTFGQGKAAGIGLLVAGATLLGAVGGAAHLVPARWRRPAFMALIWVLVVALLQTLFAQVFRTLGLSFVTEFLYERGGLGVLGAVVVWVVLFALYAGLGDRRVGGGWSIAGGTRAERRRGLFLVGVGAAVLIVAPQILGNFLSEVLDLAGIFLLMALGLNIVVGYAGLLDLGYVAFFAVGAYTAAVLTSPNAPRWTPEMTFWAAIPFVIVAAALAGIIVGTPVLRMRGDYLAIVTLGFGEIARLLFLSDALKPTFGGAQGIINIPNISVGPAEFVRPAEFFYLIYGFAIILAYASWALQESRVGRAWMAMREDESVAEATGVNIVQAKLTAFIIGAVFASLGGALFAHKIGSIFPHSFSILVSITVLMVVIVGGMASIPGVMLAAVVLVGLPELLREFAEFRFLAYGALLIFMMVKKPEGFIPSNRRSRELHEEETEQDAWLRREVEDAEAEAPAAAS